MDSKGQSSTRMREDLSHNNLICFNTMVEYVGNAENCSEVERHYLSQADAPNVMSER